jgi:hypothetical protein
MSHEGRVGSKVVYHIFILQLSAFTSAILPALLQVLRSHKNVQEGNWFLLILFAIFFQTTIFIFLFFIEVVNA